MKSNEVGPSFRIESFGCKVNTYDTGLVQKNLSENGFQSSSDDKADVFVINSCAVTAEATREAARTARRLKSKNPLSRVVITGCAAQVDTEYLSDIPGIDLVVANSHKGKIPELLDKLIRGESLEKVYKSNIFDKSDLEPGGGIEGSHTRAFLKIQDGCNSFCTYCVIPFARGKSRSLSPGDLIDRINTLHSEGYNEVVLTGVHIGDYAFREGEKDFGLADLVHEILQFTSVPRIRLSSLEPVELTDQLLQLYMDYPRLCSHFHMSIQSASSSVLKAMKRQYGRADVEQALRRIQEVRPGAFVGMDVIAGFPTETEDEFQETFEVLSSLPWNWIHAFPYSERRGTYAARLKETVPFSERKHRARRLRELSHNRYLELASKQIGTIKDALYLQTDSKGACALTGDYWPLDFSVPESAKPGDIFNVEVTEVENQGRRLFLKGSLVGAVNA